MAMSDELEDSAIAKTEEEIAEKKAAEAVETASELPELKPEDALAWFEKGKALYVADDFEEALACLSKSAEISKEQPETWHVMGYCLIALKRYPEARDALEYVKAVRPANLEAIYALGVAYALIGEPQKAKENMKLAFAIDRKRALAFSDEVYKKLFETSPDVSSYTKSLVERALETIRLKV
jgi:tetratricopeptide (TPR) repeat protein